MAGAKLQEKIDAYKQKLKATEECFETHIFPAAEKLKNKQHKFNSLVNATMVAHEEASEALKAGRQPSRSSRYEERALQHPCCYS